MPTDFNDHIFQLIKGMVETFQEKKKRKKIKERIIRGRASASATEFEEQLARLVENNTADSITILVDHPISYKIPSARTKTIYPDIVLVKDNLLISILEAKIDLGYLNEDWADSRTKIIDEIKTVQEVSINQTPYKLAPNFTVGCVVLTAKNRHGRSINIKNTFTLLSENYYHPNHEIDEGTQRDKYYGKIKNDEVNLEQWNQFKQFIDKLA